MANTLQLPKAHFIMALILPLAVILGYFLVDPLEPSSLTVLGLVLAALALPLMMQWYHPMLILLWNASIMPVFVPGSPYMWMLVALVGFMICVLNRSVNRNFRFISVPSINYALLFLVVVVGVTAYFNGGIGSQIFGSSRYGGRRYFYTFLAVIGYFVLTSRRIPAHRAMLFTSLFFLSAITALVPDILSMAGNGSSFLYQLFPPDFSAVQALSGAMETDIMFRIYGLTTASTGLFFALLARYGIRGVFDWGKPWRAGLFFLALAACVYSGFRSILILMVLTFMVQFYLEGLHRTRLLAILASILLLGGGLMLTQAERLPLVVQRTISFLPVNVSQSAKGSADASLEWRLRMWRVVLPQVPSHLLLGKGYGLDPTAMYFSGDSSANREGFEWAVVAGDYHNGPLSLVIPFGIWGLIAFGWFCVASLRYLYRNYRSGTSELRPINTLLLSCFAARLVFFLIFFGGFWGDLCLFTGIVGLSVSLNGAEPVPAARPETEILEEEFAERAYRDDYA